MYANDARRGVSEFFIQAIDLLLLLARLLEVRPDHGQKFLCFVKLEISICHTQPLWNLFLRPVSRYVKFSPMIFPGFLWALRSQAFGVMLLTTTLTSL